MKLRAFGAGASAWEDEEMAKLIYGMMQSLDGYVDGPEGNLVLPGPGSELFRRATNSRAV